MLPLTCLNFGTFISVKESISTKNASSSVTMSANVVVQGGAPDGHSGDRFVRVFLEADASAARTADVVSGTLGSPGTWSVTALIAMSQALVSLVCAAGGSKATMVSPIIRGLSPRAIPCNPVSTASR